MAVRLLYMFFPTVGNSKFSRALSEIFFFMISRNMGHLIAWTGTQLLKPPRPKNRTVPGNTGTKWGPIYVRSGIWEGDTVFGVYTRKTVHAFPCPTSVRTRICCWPKSSVALNYTSDSGQCRVQNSQYHYTIKGQKVSLHTISFHNYMCRKYRTHASTY